VIENWIAIQKLDRDPKTGSRSKNWILIRTLDHDLRIGLGSENWIAIQKLERDCDPNLCGRCPKFDPKFGSRSGYPIWLLLMRKNLAAFWFHGSRIVIQNLDHDLLLMRI
jgi:hypothetical protein